MSERKRSKQSKEEIAKQFDLPERKSKIATLLKQDGQAYCICRSSDSSRFMIACDACEEWYHGDCISISEKEAKFIKQYFCIRCQAEDPTLQTRFRKKTAPGEERKPRERRKHSDGRERRDRGRPPLIPSSSGVRCGQCRGCRATNCGRCDACCDPTLRDQNLQCIQRTCVGATNRAKRRRRDSTPEGRLTSAGEHLVGPRQCYGPGCINGARQHSKYCSDICGTKLASSRIYQVLPQRIQEWSLAPCMAEVNNRRTLEKIRKQQISIQATLTQLDKRHKELDMLVSRAKNFLPVEDEPEPEVEVEKKPGQDDDSSMYCITCGHEIHAKTAIRHMEKCFNKYESQSSFGSVFKTRIEGGNVMFCDFYNPINRTYCKRLRVLCPEHCKDAKVSDDDVCGCPLVVNVFDLTGEFCRAPKKSCVKHYVWEKIRRAEIDLERVRQWLKMDELLEQETKTRMALTLRAGVLGLMLHSTYNHEVMEKLCAERSSAPSSKSHKSHHSKHSGLSQLSGVPVRH